MTTHAFEKAHEVRSFLKSRGVEERIRVRRCSSPALRSFFRLEFPVPEAYRHSRRFEWTLLLERRIEEIKAMVSGSNVLVCTIPDPSMEIPR